MKAYSVDLRERIVAAVDAGLPRPEAARLFRVSVATIERYLKPRRERGHLTPGRSRGRTPGIGAAQYPALAAQVTAHPDDTLAQHAATWRAAQGAAVSAWAVQRALDRARITRKRSRRAPPRATRRRAVPGARMRRRATRRTSSPSTRRPPPAP